MHAISVQEDLGRKKQHIEEVKTSCRSSMAVDGRKKKEEESDFFGLESLYLDSSCGRSGQNGER